MIPPSVALFWSVVLAVALYLAYAWLSRKFRMRVIQYAAASRFNHKRLWSTGSKQPDNRMALIAASEGANDATAVQTVLIVLGEIPPSKLLEIFH